jgi:hypothetical protein
MRYAIGWMFGILVVILGLGWIIEGNEFFLYKAFAPRQEAVRRQVFEETKSYNDGMAQELASIELEYAKATPGQRAALRSLALHRFAAYDTSKLSPDMRSFLAEMQHDATAVSP